jgi:hypothetical protein
VVRAVARGATTGSDCEATTGRRMGDEWETREMLRTWSPGASLLSPYLAAARSAWRSPRRAGGRRAPQGAAWRRRQLSVLQLRGPICYRAVGGASRARGARRGTTRSHRSRSPPPMRAPHVDAHESHDAHALESHDAHVEAKFPRHRRGRDHSHGPTWTRPDLNMDTSTVRRSKPCAASSTTNRWLWYVCRSGVFIEPSPVNEVWN